jgi:RHS repeat-associated protein
MAGINSKALSFGEPGNMKKFVGQNLDKELDLNWYQFKFRNHDLQIGRFIQIDPFADKYVYNSTYAYAENRPIDGIDLEGLEFLRTVVNIFSELARNPSAIGTHI